MSLARGPFKMFLAVELGSSCLYSGLYIDKSSPLFFGTSSPPTPLTEMRSQRVFSAPSEISRDLYDCVSKRLHQGLGERLLQLKEGAATVLDCLGSRASSMLGSRAVGGEEDGRSIGGTSHNLSDIAAEAICLMSFRCAQRRLLQ